MATKKHHTTPVAAVDPTFELAEKAGTYVLRLALPGFRKDDFRVQVDGAGRLTVRGTRPGTAGPGSLHKVFQLPSAANHDNIAGRFEAGVLTLTVPKRASSSATAPTSVDEIRSKQPGMAKETKPNEEGIAKEDALKKKAMDEATEKKQEKEASQGKQEQRKSAPSPAVKEKVKPKAPQAATAPPQEPAPVKKEEEINPKAPQAAAAAPAVPPPEKSSPKPEAATGSEKAKASVAPDSLAQRVRQCGDEECAKAGAVAAEKEAKVEQEKKATAECVAGWKKRRMGELKGLTSMKWAEGLTDMKWADDVVEAVMNNKEVVAVCIAAFSVGFLVSQKLFRK